MAKSQNAAVTPLTKLAYGVGDIFGGGAMTLVGFYYLVFLTDVVRLDPALAGLVFLIGRIWDGITDPIMGFLSDRTSSRFGRRRPYFLAGVPLIVLACFLMWFPSAFNTQMGQFIFVLCSYLFYSSVITMVMVPYTALAPEITSDYKERSSLMTWRMILSNSSTLVCAVLPMEIIKLAPDMRSGYMAMGLFFGVFFGLPYLLTFFVIRERPEFSKNLPKFNFKAMFIRPFKIRLFRNTLTMYLFTMVSMDALMAMAIYFMKNYIMPDADISIFLGVMIIAMMGGTIVFSELGQRTSKRRAFIISAAGWSILMIATLLIGPNWGDFTLFTAFALVGFFMGGPIVMVYSVLADIPDVDELFTGFRREGSYSGLLTLCRKLSSALALFLVGLFINIGGYLPPVEIYTDGNLMLSEQIQPDRFILTIRLLFAFLPLLFSLIAMAGAWRYNLSPQLYKRLQSYLEESRETGGGMPSGSLSAEKSDLIKSFGA